MTNTKYPTFSGEVIHGKALGRTIGFPTANLALACDCIDLADATFGLSGIVRWKEYYGIGVYRKNLELFEAHFFEFSDDIYGEIISIRPLFFIRENQKFSSLEGLKNQIEKDREVMQKYLKHK
jgi:riboflavin kinase / FMN adenylyltransferase